MLSPHKMGQPLTTIMKSSWSGPETTFMHLRWHVRTKTRRCAGVHKISASNVPGTSRSIGRTALSYPAGRRAIWTGLLFTCRTGRSLSTCRNYSVRTGRRTNGTRPCWLFNRRDGSIHDHSCRFLNLLGMIEARAVCLLNSIVRKSLTQSGIGIIISSPIGRR